MSVLSGDESVRRAPAPGDGGLRIPGLDGLRAIAACAVLIFHASSNASASGALMVVFPSLREGVTLFFCLSGFLLYRPFAAALIRGTRPPSIRRYLLRRLLRIAPAYWFVLVLTALMLGSTAEYRGLDGLSLLGRQALLVANYSPHSIWSGLTPSWTLAIEAVFYLVLPVLAVAALRLVRDRRHWRGLTAAWLPPLVLLAVGLIGKLAVALIGGGSADSVDHDWHAVLDGSFVTHADLFSFGMGLAILHVLSADGAFSVPRWVAGTLNRVLLYVAPLLLIVGVFTLNAYIYHPVMALMATILLAKVVLPARKAPRPSLLLRTLETRPMLYLGTISYSIFLWNNTVTLFLHQHGLLAGTRTTAGVVLDIAIVACVTLVLSALTYRFVERPFLLRRAPHAADASASGRRSLSLRRLVATPP